MALALATTAATPAMQGLEDLLDGEGAAGWGRGRARGRPRAPPGLSPEPRSLTRWRRLAEALSDFGPGGGAPGPAPPAGGSGAAGAAPGAPPPDRKPAPHAAKRKAAAKGKGKGKGLGLGLGLGGGLGPGPSAAAGEGPGKDVLGDTLKALAGQAGAGGGGAPEEEMFSDEMLAKLTEQLAGAGPEDPQGFLDGIMQQLLSKDVLYEPMRDIALKYPQWLESNRDALSAEDLARYRKQFEHLQELVRLYETSPNNFEGIVARLQEMQACGQPPEAIIKELVRARPRPRSPPPPRPGPH